MFNFQSSTFLRNVLLADAAASAATGVLMALGAGFLAPVLGLPSILLCEAGIILLPFAVLVAWIAARKPPVRGWVWAVVVCNALWVLDSIVLLMSGWVAPTVLGQAFVIAQAVVVALFAELEYFALRRSTQPLAY